MPIDASIYSNVRTPDLLGSVQRGLALRDNIDSKNRKSAIQGIYSNAMVKGEDGKVSFNSGKAVSDLAEGGYGQESVQLSQKTALQDTQMKAAKLDAGIKQVGMISQMAGSVRNAQEFESMKVQAKKNNLDLGQYGPMTWAEFQPLQGSVVNRGLKTLQQMTQQRQVIQDKYQRTKDQTDTRNLRADRLSKTNKEARDTKQKDFDSVSKLRKERSSLDTTKATQKITPAYNKIMSVSKKSPAGDLALVFNYMKLLDPGSVVRESEFKSAAEARAWMSKTEESGYSIPGRVKQAIQKFDTGEFLLPEQRNDFVSQAGHLYKSQMDIQDQVDQQFKDIAIKQGYDPKDIILDFNANKPGDKKGPKTRMSMKPGFSFTNEAQASETINEVKSLSVDEVDKLFKQFGGGQ